MPWWSARDYQYLTPDFLFMPSVLVPVVLWSLFWKGLALFRAARNEQKGWFIALLVFNTMGILEIIYLLFFSNPRMNKIKSTSRSAS